MRPLRAFVCLSLCGSFAGCDDPDLDTAVALHAEQPLIGGFDVVTERYDAVGQLRMGAPTSMSRTAVCTATLISETEVLTAKHCLKSTAFAGRPYSDNNTLYFYVGADTAHPRHVVEAVLAERAGGTGGFVNEGNDVAVLHLATPILDVTPLPLADAPLAASAVGDKLSVIGYGAKGNERSSSWDGDTRTVGAVTLQAVAGKLYPAVFGTFDDFVASVPEYERQYRAAELRKRYDDTTLLPGGEVVAGGAPGDAVPCNGDSGGPLLVRSDDGVRVVGVVSGGFESPELVCDRAAVFATFDAPTTALLQASLAWVDPCAGLTTEGICEGDVASRCTSRLEGERRATRIDCGALDLTCGLSSTGAATCVAPGP